MPLSLKITNLCTYAELRESKFYFFSLNSLSSNIWRQASLFFENAHIAVQMFLEFAQIVNNEVASAF